MYARYRFVQYAVVCHYRPFVYVSIVPDWVKPCHRLCDKVSPSQVLHIHTFFYVTHPLLLVTFFNHFVFRNFDRRGEIA
jgi:hypothetical protein